MLAFTELGINMKVSNNDHGEYRESHATEAKQKIMPSRRSL